MTEIRLTRRANSPTLIPRPRPGTADRLGALRPAQGRQIGSEPYGDPTQWFRFGDRRRRAAALAATRGDARITIDGGREPFLTLTTPSGRWVAVRRHHNLTVTIAARDIDPGTITLEPIADPAASLLGSEPETT